MPLLMATSKFRLARKCQSSPQWCDLHHLCAITLLEKLQNTYYAYVYTCYVQSISMTAKFSVHYRLHQ